MLGHNNSAQIITEWIFCHLQVIYSNLDLISSAVRVHPELFLDVITELDHAHPGDVTLNVQHVCDVTKEPSRHLVVGFVDRTG